ncbi:Pycsar system effector family protein [Streptomyces sp. NPDC049879]|uniref:Pycsar system effector family protein n=1 Tax=Streptomyces sp. NPDC049879 TaxID=3365598 RepID=UPI0037A5F198
MADPVTGAASGPLAERLLAEIRVEIARADGKAASLVGALGLTTGLLGGAVAASDWSPGALSVAAQVLWWVGVAGLSVSLTAFLLTVAPRYGRGRWTPGAPLTYFGDVLRAAKGGQLAEALAASTDASGDRLLHALGVTSRIAMIKLRWVRVGLVSFIAGMVCVPAALFIG